MANPPITVGELADVPAPGSAVASTWAQEVSNRVIQRFATPAVRDSTWPATTFNKGALAVTLNNMKLWQSTGTAWVSASDTTPVGTVRETIKTSADPGWLVLDGATINGADATYPDLWAIVPASWKSGTSLLLPNMSSRTLMGAGGTANGALGGNNARTIVNGNLPPHNHTIDHDHGNAVTDSQGAHTHNGNVPNVFFHINRILGTSIGKLSTTGNGGDTETFPSTSIVTDSTGAHQHNFDMPPFGGNSGNGPGTSTPMDVTPAHLAVTYQIKAVV